MTPSSTTKKKLFFLVFCLASVTQGMYSTYFVSILTTIERIYQIQSKTAGAIMSATEIGQILGALLIAYYGGKGNKPKWIAACMTLTAIAALISTTPHFLMKPSSSPTHKSQQIDIVTEETSPHTNSDLMLKSLSTSSEWSTIKNFNLPSQEQLCKFVVSEPLVLNSTYSDEPSIQAVKISKLINNKTFYGPKSYGWILMIFFTCLLAIGFGSTAITTLGIPFIDDIVSKEESPLYLGLTIGLKIFGPALGFLLGSFCIRLDVNLFDINSLSDSNGHQIKHETLDYVDPNLIGVGAWWLGLIIISIPLLLLAIPMYYLSKLTITNDITKSESLSGFEDITYQAAEDHDIGGSRDFQRHVLTIGDLDVTSNKTCYSEIDSSSREILQAKSLSDAKQFKHNFGKNIILDRTIITKESINSNDSVNKTLHNESWKNTSCIIVSHFGDLEPTTSFNNDEVQCLKSSSSSSTTETNPPTLARPPPSSLSSSSSGRQSSTMNLSNSLSRLIKNKLLLLRLVSGILHILPIAGFYTFLPKYLIEQYRIAPSSASAISGLAGILFVGFGAFMGGTVIRLFNINSKLMTRWIATSALLYSIGMLVLMNLGCPENQIVYHESVDFKLNNCLVNCNCPPILYNPVCIQNTTYISPCLAGCKNYTITDNDKIVFSDCGCSQSEKVESVTYTKSDSNYLKTSVATQGHCLHDCDNLKWYIIIFSIFTLIHASSEVGSMMFNLRCVKSNDRTLALGLITFTSSLLGTIPCSVIYGTVIDLTCIHWDTLTTSQQDSLYSKGACRAYKNDSFRFYLHGFTGFVIFLAFIVDCFISSIAEKVDFYDRKVIEYKKKGVSLRKSLETI